MLTGWATTPGGSDELAERGGFDVVGGMPAYGGYAVGYHIVRAFLEETGMGVEEATYLPTDEIIQRSKFFDG